MMFLKRIYYRIFGLRRVDVLREALKLYNAEVERGLFDGLCSVIFRVLKYYGCKTDLFLLREGQVAQFYIPEFGKGRLDWGRYWWDECYTRPRIAYLNKLIALYKDDKTNLLSKHYGKQK